MNKRILKSTIFLRIISNFILKKIFKKMVVIEKIKIKINIWRKNYLKSKMNNNIFIMLIW